MRHLTLSFLFLGFAAGLMAQSKLVPFHEQTDFLFASPGGLGTGLYGFDNPAMLNYVRHFDVLYAWQTNPGKWSGLSRWGLFTAVRHLGFGVMHDQTPGSPKSVTDYRLALGFGDRTFGMGVGYGWSGNADKTYNRSSLWTLGFLIRPDRHVSFGLTGISATAGGDKEGIIDVAVRPFGTELLTLFGDMAAQTKKPDKDAAWSAGAAVEALPGVRFTARYFDTEAFTIGMNFSFGRMGLASQTHLDDRQKQSRTTYAVRLGAYDRNLWRTHVKDRDAYLKLDLKGPVKYRPYVLFDKSTTFYELIDRIDAAERDPGVAGIAISLSGVQINRELAWEVRERLRMFRSSGKKVVMYIDRADMTDYHLASVADRIVMDPQGMLLLEGYVMGRTFLKGTLEKLGIGYDEWRYFKYKSAAEVFSREKMSEGDREQRQAMLDDLYDLVRSEVCASRSMSTEAFDRLIDETFLFLPQDALKAGLVDTLGRWDVVEKVIERMEGARKSTIRPWALEKFHLPYDNRWGEPPRIAVIYALGVCDLEEGIAARKLANVFDRVTKDRRIKAVVLRVDSPGGDALASDLVAEAMKECRKKKPVVVSQGFVAASGGYWISMYADTIVASPQTITGSIGVIGGWMYNSGLKEKLGFSTDHVKVGKHGDALYGFRMPFVGLGLPDRNLDDSERARAEYAIKTLYQDFLTRVAEGRKQSVNDVETVAQGRVWSGIEGKEKGLVDVLGGLDRAIAIAKRRARIPDDCDVTIVQMPRPPLFDPNLFLSGLRGAQQKTDGWYEHLKWRLERNGQPLPILPLDDMEWQED